MREYLTGYIQGFSAFSDSRYDGSLIARLHYERWENVYPSSQFTSRVRLNHLHYQKLRVEGWHENRMSGFMEMTLLFSAANNLKAENKPVQESSLPENVVFWNSFSRKEVLEFSQRTGDKNSIHLEKQPVVQGLLLMQQLFFKLDEPRLLDLRFFSPVHSDEKIYLKKETSDCCQAFCEDGRHLFSAVFYADTH